MRVKIVKIKWVQLVLIVEPLSFRFNIFLYSKIYLIKLCIYLL